MSLKPDPVTPALTDQTACGLLRLLMVILYDAIIVLAILLFAGAMALALPLGHQSAGKDPAYTLYLLLFWFLYLAWCWRHGGMTLGMRAWHVRLVNAQGDDPLEPPHWWQCGLRFIGSWLSLLPAGLGYGWIVFDREKRSWHDRLSRTRLVCTKVINQQTESDAAPEEVNRGESE